MAACASLAPTFGHGVLGGGMLLLVAGLVVIVLVILVVVFLSVRSMRADEGRDRPARPAARDRSGRGDLRRQEAGRQPGRRRPAEDDWPADHEPDFREPEHDRARGRLPRPRRHQDDEDPGRRAAPQKRPDARRRQRQESASRISGSGRDKSDADWLAGDWGGVSDEQYWAELSADKPLATTARSAQAGGGAHPDAAAWQAEADADPADLDGRGAHRDLAPARSQPDPAPTLAAAGASTAQFSLHSGPAQPGWPPAGPADPPVPSEPPAFAGPAAVAEPAALPEPWADPMGTGSVDTDPSIGMGGWQDAADRTAPWQAPGRDEPAALDSRAWAEDPLTSPSFSESGSYRSGSRSYGGSPTRDLGLDQPGDGSGSSSYGHGYDYPTAPAWQDSYANGHEDGWRDSGHEYPSGRLDPLPEPAASAAEPDGSWYSAPASPGAPSYGQAPHEPWDRREAGYDDALRSDPYTEPGRRSWPDHHESARYDPAGYDAGHGRDSAPPGYHGDTGYDPAGYDQTGYDPAGYDPTGYDPAGYGPDVNGYGQPGYGAGESGYRSSRHGSPDTGYALPDYDRGYQQPRHGTPDAGYGPPEYGSGASPGSPDQGSGYGRYPGYDAGRR